MIVAKPVSTEIIRGQIDGGAGIILADNFEIGADITGTSLGVD